MKIFLSSIGKETLDICKQGIYITNNRKRINIMNEIKNSIQNSKLYDLNYSKNMVIKKPNNDLNTKITVINQTTLYAAKQYNNTVCLNFASAKNPGGGFLKNSIAQEESLARSSSLHSTINQFQEMYEYNRNCNTALYSDYCIYSKNVPVFRNNLYELLDEPYLTSFITSPAVNASVVLHQEKNNISKIESVMYNRAKIVLNIALENNHKNIVLGAWGCGVFGCDSNMIANIFKQLLNNEFKNCFENIIFAIYDKTPDEYIYNTFNKIFKENY